LQADLQPTYDWAGIVRLPIFWEDDVHCVYFTNQFQLNALSLNRPGMKIFNFHPVHCYLNTQEFHHYQKVKGDLHDLKKAAAAKQSGQGTQSLFLALLQEIKKSGESTTLSNAAMVFQQQHTYQGHVRNWLRQQSKHR